VKEPSPLEDDLGSVVHLRRDRRCHDVVGSDREAGAGKHAADIACSCVDLVLLSVEPELDGLAAVATSPGDGAADETGESQPV